eukprot:5999956-Pleurochrysis_carterae.AAC.6
MSTCRVEEMGRRAAPASSRRPSRGRPGRLPAALRRRVTSSCRRPAARASAASAASPPGPATQTRTYSYILASRWERENRRSPRRMSGASLVGVSQDAFSRCQVGASRRWREVNEYRSEGVA